MLNVSLTESASGRRFGAFPSRHDFRDFTLPRKIALSATPPTHDLTAWRGPIKDQGSLGACTGFGASSCQEFLIKKYGKIADGADAPVFSPLFVYYKEREREGDIYSDSGAQIRTAAEVLIQDGICFESEDPYQPFKFMDAPTEAQILQAAKWRGGAYHRLLDIGDMRGCIASGYPFLLGFTVYEGFEDLGSDGLMKMPKPKERALGGHCVLAGLGYDDSKGTITCQNSWGLGWGRGGMFDMPYEFISNSDLTFDALVVHLGHAW